jgi:hypothetical protein
MLRGVWMVLGYTVLGCTAERTPARRPHLWGNSIRVASAAMILAALAILSDQALH